MPSPIAHASVGYLIYRIFANNSNKKIHLGNGTIPQLLWMAVALSLLPDLDFIPGLLLGGYDQFHNTFSHSLFTGLAFALITGMIGWLKKGSFGFWFLFPLLSYEMHVIMDFFTLGRGLMLLWPFINQRYEPEIYFFYGLHRSDGLISVRHLWTLLTELGFAIVILLMPKIYQLLEDLGLRKMKEINLYSKEHRQ